MTEGHEHDSHPRRSKRTVVLAAAVAGALVATLMTLVVTRDHGAAQAGSLTGGPSGGRSLAPSTAVASPNATNAATAANPIVPGVAAATPEAAVRAYLDAEIAKDYAASYRQLSAGDRRATSANAWAAVHPQLPGYTAYRVEAPTPQIVTTVQIRPTVDEVVGVMPGQARITWSTLPEDGGYRIVLNASRFEPIYPADSGASDAALTWVKQHQACSTASDYKGSLVGTPSLAERLCRYSGSFTAGAVKDLDAYANSTAVLTAFGPDASDWARVVSLSGAGNLDVVTAPLGDHWVVVGVSGKLG